MFLFQYNNQTVWLNREEDRIWMVRVFEGEVFHGGGGSYSFDRAFSDYQRMCLHVLGGGRVHNFGATY